MSGSGACWPETRDGTIYRKMDSHSLTSTDDVGEAEMGDEVG